LPGSPAWKVVLAAYLEGRTLTPNRWVAQRLGFGRPVHVSPLVPALRRQAAPPSLIHLREICNA
jgi:hypothetical protein